MIAGRDLGLTGLPNARDLGGYPAAEGRSVRAGLLLRAEALTNATPEDIGALVEMGVGTVVDLRGESEIAMFGVGPWTGPRAHVPTTDLTQALFARMMSAGPDGEPLAEDEVSKVMIDMYRHFVADESSRAAYAEALDLVTEQVSQGTPILFHCTAGKDRTGWLSAIVLTALGADRDTVLEDYLLTNQRATEGRGAPARAKLLALLRQLVGDRQPIAPLLDVRREYLQAAFEEAETKYGTFDAYLRKALGANIDRLRAAALL
ncbi:tyrosine-protein phosphatase [Actinospica sp. MGRD01-02]|uniref:Tyrosine-protein phosphatase n=1 Tax=Actinospica acidithermotolerans TaxID=2828514 RepID=A0A941ILS6_9ACTN|nr:tyrosine-protein phosphatase [Actinospica acidithermotolerans]MBR7827906.1 tyrosine-protein phosphatase [Actinospica acidithermotolerans]